MVSTPLKFLAFATLAGSAMADYVIDPSTVSLTTRKLWCNQELSTCPLICQQTSTGEPLENSCDPITLTYGCVCSDNRQPNMSEYSLTLPYFTCQEWGTQCVSRCGTNNECSRVCRENHPCGAQNPTRVNTTTAGPSTPSATATATAGTVFSGLDGSGSGSSAAPDNTSTASDRLEAASLMGFAVLASGLVGVVAFLL